MYQGAYRSLAIMACSGILALCGCESIGNNPGEALNNAIRPTLDSKLDHVTARKITTNFGIIVYTGQVIRHEILGFKPYGRGYAEIPDVMFTKNRYVGDVLTKGDITAPDGRGLMILPDGTVLNGDFREGAFEGNGTKTWPDGSQYSGQFVRNKRHGTGRMAYANGQIEDGVWREDEFAGGGLPTNQGSAALPTLSASEGYVTIASEDPAYEVFIDGGFVGNTPAKLKLSEGVHLVEVKKSGLKNYRKKIKVSHGSELNLRITLEPN